MVGDLALPRGVALTARLASVLVVLMELQASRLRTRVGPSGEPVLLLDQDRGRWDHVLIGRGLAALARAEVRWPWPSGRRKG